MRTTFDESDLTVLAVCACGWRGLALTYPQALRRAVLHEETRHPKDKTVRARARREGVIHSAQESVPATG